MELLTVGNMILAGDPRYSIMHQNFNNWVLVIMNVDKMDEGRYICTVQTFPKESLIVFVRVDGKSNNQTEKCKMDKKKSIQRIANTSGLAHPVRWRLLWTP